MTLPLLVSAEAATISWLLAQNEVTTIAGNRIRTALSQTSTWPQIRVTRVAGVGDQYWRDLPRVRIECWGDLQDKDHPNAAPAMDVLVRTIQACVPRAASWAGPIAGMQVAYGPLPLPDPDTNRARYLLDVTFAAFEETS